MKTIKRVTIAISIIFCHSLSNAQQAYFSPSEWLTEHKKSISSTSYIIEGTITQQYCYYGKGQQEGVLTCSVLQINKIYKGNPQLKLGTIKIITEQGGFVKNSQYPATSPSDGGGVALYKSGTYIIFGRQAYSYMLVDSMPATDDSTVLTTMDCDYPIIFSGDNGAKWHGTEFKTKEDIYSFFKENGVTMQEEVK